MRGPVKRKNRLSAACFAAKRIGKILENNSKVVLPTYFGKSA